MPSISVVENLDGLTNNLNQIRQQTREAEVESFRIEGMIRVFKSLQDVGVTEIPVPEGVKVLEPPVDEVIDNPEEVKSLSDRSLSSLPI